MSHTLANHSLPLWRCAPLTPCSMSEMVAHHHQYNLCQLEVVLRRWAALTSNSHVDMTDTNNICVVVCPWDVGGSVAAGCARLKMRYVGAADVEYECPAHLGCPVSLGHRPGEFKLCEASQFTTAFEPAPAAGEVRRKACWQSADKVAE